jgi:hypothetical protein
MKAVMVFCVVVFFLGCDAQAKRVVSDFSTFADEMCLCEDRDCVSEVNTRFKEFVANNKGVKGSRKMRKKARAVRARYETCIAKAIQEKGKK